MKIFVWLAGSNGPNAQLWHDEPMTGEGKSKVAPLFQYKLTEDEEKALDGGALTLAYFMERFKNSWNPSTLYVYCL